jgi:hypothetical protein
VRKGNDRDHLQARLPVHQVLLVRQAHQDHQVLGQVVLVVAHHQVLDQIKLMDDEVEMQKQLRKVNQVRKSGLHQGNSFFKVYIKQS